MKVHGGIPSKFSGIQVFRPRRPVSDAQSIQRSPHRRQHPVHLGGEQLADAADPEAVHHGELAGIDNEALSLISR
jgi:hypothetical protein